MKTSTTLTKRARRRGEDEWRELLVRFDVSGQSREQFCVDQGLGISTFSRWRQRLRAQGREDTKVSPQGVFVELSSGDAPRAVAPPPWDVELQLGEGVLLRLRRAPC